MAVPALQFYWLTGGFFLGMFFMYNLMPFRTNVQKAHGRHHARADTNPILKFGNPGPVADLLERTAYTASFNRKDRIPHWVGEHLTAQGIIKGDGVTRDSSSFVGDPAIPALFRITTKDYTYSGYDRGHMAPAGDAGATQAGLDQTFLLTNIAPQVGVGFNRQYWAYLETFVRDLTKNYTDVYVYTGPLFLPTVDNAAGTTGSSAEYAFAGAKVTFGDEGIQKRATSNSNKYTMTYKVIGDTTANVAVPTHFFKIVLSVKDGKYTLGAFVLPNQAIDNSVPLTSFQVDLQAIEKASGLLFFDTLDRSTFLKLCDAVSCVVK
ncbi:hypothetical protein INT47_000216 [Mucor saturninus]|uniref:Endonuclease n=1 Tax=Mucor saturninus TaxID=64648 RepID=A0A8H7R514_9FUNG|nr:hypothetical protein INT47_000216 [Mucor saturninus]